MKEVDVYFIGRVGSEVGFRLAGVRNICLINEEGVDEQLGILDSGVYLVTREALELMGDRIHELKRRGLVQVIPDVEMDRGVK